MFGDTMHYRWLGFYLRYIEELNRRCDLFKSKHILMIYRVNVGFIAPENLFNERLPEYSFVVASTEFLLTLIQTKCFV